MPGLSRLKHDFIEAAFRRQDVGAVKAAFFRQPHGRLELPG
jgi:hypothetical protein